MNEHPALPPLPAARLGGAALALPDLLRQQHRRGRLLPWLRRAAVEAFLLAEAGALGLEVGADELQRGADLFRRRRGLLSAEQTHAWLARQRLSPDDFEVGLRDALLLARLRDHVSAAPAAERFAASPADFDRVLLRVCLAPTEDLAREVLSQLEEGAELAELARKHSTHPSARRGGLAGSFRCQLSPPVREAAAGAPAGAVLGPLATPGGFLVLRVEAIKPAEQDAGTVAFLRREAYRAWLRGKLDAAEFAAPLLDTLS